MLLAKTNRHPRDENITFEEEGHVYTIKGSTKHPISVTTLIHHWFPVFDASKVVDNMMKSRKWKLSKYYGKSKAEIIAEWDNNGKTASHLGTLMHADIERCLNQESVKDANSKEHQLFTQFWELFQKTNPTFKPFRTEWLVYDEDSNIAGSIDCVLSDSNGNIIILDWKRSKEIKMSNSFEKGYGPLAHLDHCNYNHYTLQVNIYRHILEKKYGKNIVAMFIVVLHPDNDTFKLYQINHYDVAGIWPILTDQSKFTH